MANWGVVYVCSVCMSEAIRQSTRFPVGGAKWNVSSQSWVVSFDEVDLSGSYWCEDCQAEVDTITETVSLDSDKEGNDE